MGTLKNMKSTHLTDEQISEAKNLLNLLNEAVKPALTNLTAEERKRYGSIGEQNKLFVNKILEYSINQPLLRSPDVDWEEFARDFKSRAELESLISMLQELQEGLVNGKTLHDHDNYQFSLKDYHYTAYKATTSTAGYAVKLKDIKQFFSKVKGAARNSNQETE